MLTRIRKAMEDKESGFTLIELLVVMIIIGILAAIAIPVFLNQRKGAVDASIKSDLRTISTEVESYYTDTQLYPGSPTAATFTNGIAPQINTTPATVIKVSKGNSFTYTYVAGTDSYCIRAQNVKSSSPVNGWYYNSAKGGLQPKTATAC